MDSNEQPNAVVLLIIGEPFSEEEKTLILDEVTKGFGSWDVEDTGININDELAQIANRSSQGVEGTNGEQIIQHQSDNLAVEILVNPCAQTVKHSVKKLLIAPAPTKYIVYAGHVFQGSGAWVLQDDTFGFNSLAQVFRNSDVENALKQNIEANLTIHTLADSNWGTSISKADFTNNLRIQLNPPGKLDNINGVLQFVAYVGVFIKAVPITSLLQASEQFGNISFTRPTLYIFPGCQGDSALFGISGFNLLVNGGYNRRACFWDFARHLDRIDAMLMTHLGTDNIFGLQAVLQRKIMGNIHPQIGYLYFNAVEKPGLLSSQEEGDSDASKKSSLLLNLSEEANKITQMAKQLGISPHPCSRNATAATGEPINLYHKLGHGSLDMYVLNPVADSKELKEFNQLWGKQAVNLGTSGAYPLQNALSVCTLLVWKPYNVDEKIVRIMFPGNAPQHKIIEGLEKMKGFDFLKHATCSMRDLTKPAPVKKAAPGQSKVVSSGKGPAKVVKNEAVKSLNVTKLESPHKETKPVPAKSEVKSSSPAKPTKAAKEENGKKNYKGNEKAKGDEKEIKIKSVPKNDDKGFGDKKQARPVSAPSPVKGADTSSVTSLSTKPTTFTKSSSSFESSSVKSPAKAKDLVTGNAENSKSLVAAAPADLEENDASAVGHVDKCGLKAESELDQRTEFDVVDTLKTVDTISEARDAVGVTDDLSVSMTSTDKQRLHNLGIYDEEQETDLVNGSSKFELEDDDKPQALPEPAAMIESPSQESDGLSEYSCKIEVDLKEMTAINSPADKEYKLKDHNKTHSDPAQDISPSPEPSQDEQRDYYYPTSTKQPDFETPTFTNDGPDSSAIPNLSSVEQNIQYGIDNSSNGRDMGGIQEVDEEEQEDEAQMEGTLDNETLRDMGIYDEEDTNRYDKNSVQDDEEIKQEQEEEEECGSDSRTSAERQFEDVDDEAPQPAQDSEERLEDYGSSSLPAAFDKDSSPEVNSRSQHEEETPKTDHGFAESEDKDSIDGGIPDEEQSVEEAAFFKDNDFNQTGVKDTSSDMSASNGSLNPFIGVGDFPEEERNSQSQDFGEKNDEIAASFDPVSHWGHPMGLPSPVPPADKRSHTNGKKGPETTNGTEKSSGPVRGNKSGEVTNDPKFEGKKRVVSAPNVSAKTISRQGSAIKKFAPGSSRSSPTNAKTLNLPPMAHFYVDLTYVPNHADLLYSDVEFFKRIRARYYVISTLSPNPQVLDSLLEAKSTWEQKDLEVTIIPTYDNETLRHWLGLNAEKLQELRIDLKPAVSRCTIQLLDLETSLPAYRLEV